jgi:hypothetical protein
MNSQLADLIEASFGSVWSLELLLRLHRDPARTWQPIDLVRELRSSDVIVQRSIEELTAAGLIVVEANGSVRYSPASGVQGGLVDELADEYERRPSAIRRMIVQNPTEKLRSFSDAFKLTKS